MSEKKTREKRLYEWKRRWQEFVALYPEVLTVPIQADRSWFVEQMAKWAEEFERESGGGE